MMETFGVSSLLPPTVGRKSGTCGGAGLRMAERIRVMIVDDSGETRESVRLLLGFSSDIEVVTEAENGRIALEELTRVGVDVVIMDVNMPEMDGITATARIQQLYPQVDVVMLSAESFPEDMARCLEAGARVCLRKPVTSSVLISAVESANNISAQKKRGCSVRYTAAKTTRSVRVQPMYIVRDPE